MLTMLVRSGYRAFALASVVASVVLLAGCSATPVLHEFPQPFEAEMRPSSAVDYSLRETESGSGEWVLRGGQGDVVGGFRWEPSFRDAKGADGETRREDLFQDAINGTDYIFQIGASSDSLGSQSGWQTAPPRVVIFNAATAEQVGELELRIGFDNRFEGIWRGRAILWRATLLPGAVVPNDAGDVEDHYPDAQLLEWTGGSNAGLRVYSGRTVTGEPPAFAEAIFDVTAGRPLTRRELGDSVVLLFAIRALEQSMGITESE
ncbi:MAG TPA: hypothetical protein VF275_09055 [Gammaproteobacteria bacterium]